MGVVAGAVELRHVDVEGLEEVVSEGGGQGGREGGREEGREVVSRDCLTFFKAIKYIRRTQKEGGGREGERARCLLDLSFY